MKRNLIVLMFLMSIGANGQSLLEPLFKTACNNYSKEKYTEAIQQFEQIRMNGFESPELYYNLGNAYYKQKNYPKAILNFERAQLLSPGNENIQHNLSKARMYNIDKIDEIPQFIFKSWFTKLVSYFSSNTWAIISMFTFVMGFASLLFYFFSLKIILKKGGFYLAFSLLVISIGTFYFASNAKTLITHSNGAIVMKPTVTIKSSPRESGTDLFIVHEGTKVFIVSQLDNWYEIKLSDGKQGWLEKLDIEAI